MKIMKHYAALCLSLLLIAGCGSAPQQQNPSNLGDLILATTTSTQDTGLLDLLVPQFEKEAHAKVKVIAVGSGEALAMGERGEADAILSHAPSSEQKLVDSGVVINRHQVMHNDFVLVGPASDPAKIKGEKSAVQAFKRIADSKAPFVSRGDDSGTHKKEKELWAGAALQPKGAAWYLESGTGQARTLSIASEKGGYTLSDRGTYLSQQKNIQLDVLVEGDGPLLNIYHVMQVNPAKFSKVNKTAAEAFVNFMLKRETQETIAKFGVDKYGKPLFYTDAKG